jgi:putative folate metabolism gamma-glutamate ligase
MQISAVKTKRVEVGNSIDDILEALPALQENDIVCITSKIISICEGAVVDKSSVPDKIDLIYREADLVLPPPAHNPYNIHLTIKNSLLIPTAGIDESNGGDIYILYPKDIQKSATETWNKLRGKHGLKNLGILITDSHTTPMRRGVTGLGIGWCGFEALYDYVGKPDCFGKPLRVTKINIQDALAASAVFVMGEGDEQTPIAIIKNAPKIVFQDRPPSAEEIAEITISLEDDLYAPILMNAPWIRK